MENKFGKRSLYTKTLTDSLTIEPVTVRSNLNFYS